MIHNGNMCILGNQVDVNVYLLGASMWDEVLQNSFSVIILRTSKCEPFSMSVTPKLEPVTEEFHLFHLQAPQAL